ncbi:MAG: TlpA disulfide reductase family protein [Cyclobacteriaceae bacterium]|nr:TlpA disulfide reductase family protein [Cyclobacteriaceae bacterium]
MKKVLFIVLGSAIFLGACDVFKSDKNPAYTIDATIRGIDDSTSIFLYVRNEGEMKILDTVALKDSKAQFTGVVDSPEMMYLNIGTTNKAINLFVENAKIQISVHADSLDKAVVTGSKTQDDFMAFKTALEPIEQRSNDLNQRYQVAMASGDTAAIRQIQIDADQLYPDQNAAITSFISDKNASFLTPYIIRNYLVFEMEVGQLDSMLSKLDTTVHRSPDYKFLADRVAVMQKVALGQPALDFALNDPAGTPVAISSFKGKYLLIDFWASWCGPCRRENPNVVQLYNDFNEKGFEIIGVSFDDDREKWLKAIDDDKLTWAHVSDLQGWGCEAGKLYAVNSIPATVLLNREGIIIAKNLRGDALRKKLEELLLAEGQNI